ncbi:hypothetical protein, partial [Pseudomonas viridiflava]|uniref:hypothetical protein n=1 Tax=Pseudomonas viridiflava TaxID=33069 RepID=UPI00197E75BB
SPIDLNDGSAGCQKRGHACNVRFTLALKLGRTRRRASSAKKDERHGGKNLKLCNSSAMTRCLHARHPDLIEEKAHVDH